MNNFKLKFVVGDYDQFRELSLPVPQPIGRPILPNAQNILDRSSTSLTSQPKDLAELFTSLGLTKYTTIFKQQEVCLLYIFYQYIYKY